MSRLLAALRAVQHGSLYAFFIISTQMQWYHWSQELQHTIPLCWQHKVLSSSILQESGNSSAMSRYSRYIFNIVFLKSAVIQTYAESCCWPTARIFVKLNQNFQDARTGKEEGLRTSVTKRNESCQWNLD